MRPGTRSRTPGTAPEPPPSLWKRVLNWNDRRLLKRKVIVTVSILGSLAVFFAVDGKPEGSLYVLGLSALWLALWMWRSPRI